MELERSWPRPASAIQTIKTTPNKPPAAAAAAASAAAATPFAASAATVLVVVRLMQGQWKGYALIRNDQASSRPLASMCGQQVLLSSRGRRAQTITVVGHGVHSESFRYARLLFERRRRHVTGSMDLVLTHSNLFVIPVGAVGVYNCCTCSCY